MKNLLFNFTQEQFFMKKKKKYLELCIFSKQLFRTVPTIRRKKIAVHYVKPAKPENNDVVIKF